MLDTAKQNENWTKPAALAIPKEGVFESEQGRFGPIFPKTPANYGFSVVAKVKPGSPRAGQQRQRLNMRFSRLQTPQPIANGWQDSSTESAAAGAVAWSSPRAGGLPLPSRGTVSVRSDWTKLHSPLSLKSFGRAWSHVRTSSATRGKNHPDHWVGGLASPDLHAVIMLFARDVPERHRAVEQYRQYAAQFSGVGLLSTLELEALPPFEYAHEHFGYHDRLSEPAIEGTGEVPTPGSGPPLKPGEFFLGYPDEAGEPGPLPQPEILSHNGSFLATVDSRSTSACSTNSCSRTAIRRRNGN